LFYFKIFDLMEAAVSSATGNLPSSSLAWTFFVRVTSPADFKDGDPDDWKSQAECKLCAVAISLGSKQAKYQSIGSHA
jgi:hypothetical protein